MDVGMKANDGTPFFTTIHLPWDGSFVSPAWTADMLISRAREERCCLDHYWEQAALLTHYDQLRVAKELERIEPARLPGSGTASSRSGGSPGARVSASRRRSSVTAGHPSRTRKPRLRNRLNNRSVSRSSGGCLRRMRGFAAEAPKAGHLLLRWLPPACPSRKGEGGIR
jgi:hypothetical protein